MLIFGNKPTLERSVARRTKTSKNRHRRRKPIAANAVAPESRSSLVTTVAWVLMSMVALASVALGLLLHSLSAASKDAAGLALLADLFQLVALVAGGMALLLTPVVYLLREVKPPRAVIVTIILIGMTPAVVFGVSKWLALFT